VLAARTDLRGGLAARAEWAPRVAASTSTYRRTGSAA
jgi:hypothetical protein